MVSEFRKFAKIPRGQAEQITISEKMDGTNACVIVEKMEDTLQHYIGGVQSKNRSLSLSDDNFGFCQWASERADDLSSGLGEGYHYGEWCGPGIQKNRHQLDKRRFYLFNAGRWAFSPEHCRTVRVLYDGIPDNAPSQINVTMSRYGADCDLLGLKPEGIVVWYHKTRRYEKYTFENQAGKWGNISNPEVESTGCMV